MEAIDFWSRIAVILLYLLAGGALLRYSGWPGAWWERVWMRVAALVCFLWVGFYAYLAFVIGPLPTNLSAAGLLSRVLHYPTASVLLLYALNKREQYLWTRQQLSQLHPSFSDLAP